MTIRELLATRTPTLSYELFPPRTPAAEETLAQTMDMLAATKPDFMSITYGASGSTRSTSREVVHRLAVAHTIPPLAHLTCVDQSRAELIAVIESYLADGVRDFLALRGDPPKGDAAFRPHPDGFAHASDLIAFIKKDFGFTVGCAFYPEKHVEAPSPEADMQALKLKQDNGADFAVSQLFFDNANFLRFREKAVAMGITLPLVAGIMPVLDLKQLPRFEELSGCVIPADLPVFLAQGDVIARGIEYATRQCDELLRNGIAGLHLYCLNKHASVTRITENLRALGHFPAPVTA